jgi:hypothetical protein
MAQQTHKLEFSTMTSSSPSLSNLLYFKDEVEAALILALLNKNEEAAIFWAYEIHYSGFEDGIFSLLEKIYYYFYATLNPNFKPFLNRKLGSREFQDINDIVANLLIRSYNLDIFLLLQSCKSVKIPANFDGDLVPLMASKKYATVSKYVLHTCSETEFTKMAEGYGSRLEYLAHLMQPKDIQTPSKGTYKPGHKLYLESEYVAPEIGENPVLYKILEIHCNYGVNDSGLLSGFELDRPKEYKNVQELWFNHWLYYACRCPVWLERVESYQGSLDNEKKSVIFASEDQEEAFYNQFGLEPDEQKRETQEKVIPELLGEVKVSDFYQKYKGDLGIYKITKNALEKINKLRLL